MSLRMREMFLDVFDRPRISNNLLSVCSPATVLNLEKVCRISRGAVNDYTEDAFDINDHLSRFFPDPLAFRRLQQKKDILISGSNALQFLGRTFWPESDLDIYVPKDNAWAVCLWIMENGGREYKYVRRPEDIRADDEPESDWDDSDEDDDGDDFNMRGPPDRGDESEMDIFERDFERIDDEFLGEYNDDMEVRATFTFKSTVEDGEEPLKIQVIIGKGSPLSCILGFHSTVVQNLITWSHAYSLYPKATFEEKRTLFLRRQSPMEDAVKKYIRRGWAGVPRLPVSVLNNRSFTNSLRIGQRWLGDRQTWALSLDTTGLDAADSAPPVSIGVSSDFNPLLYSSWELVYRRDGQMRIDFKYEDEHTTAFHYAYTFSPKFHEHFWRWAAQVENREDGGPYVMDRHLIHRRDSFVEPDPEPIPEDPFASSSGYVLPFIPNMQFISGPAAFNRALDIMFGGL